MPYIAFKDADEAHMYILLHDVARSYEIFLGRVSDVKKFLQSEVLLKYLLLVCLFEYMVCVLKKCP